MTPSSRLTEVLALIDAENKQDPNQEVAAGQTWPKEYLYSVRMSQRQQQFVPEASELLQIACRAQHIKRWSIPRSDYPVGRAGYLRWRTELGQFHGDLCAQLMNSAGYSQEEQARIKEILLKKRLKRDPEVQALEDVICLVFIEHYLADFAERHDEQKIIAIIQKTWGKMSEQGQAAALKLPLSDEVLALVSKALGKV